MISTGVPHGNVTRCPLFLKTIFTQAKFNYKDKVQERHRRKYTHRQDTHMLLFVIPVRTQTLLSWARPWLVRVFQTGEPAPGYLF